MFKAIYIYIYNSAEVCLQIWEVVFFTVSFKPASFNFFPNIVFFTAILNDSRIWGYINEEDELAFLCWIGGYGLHESDPFLLNAI